MGNDKDIELPQIMRILKENNSYRPHYLYSCNYFSSNKTASRDYIEPLKKAIDVESPKNNQILFYFLM